MEWRLTNKRTAAQLFDNIKGLVEVGMPISPIELSYVKLAFLEDADEADTLLEVVEAGINLELLADLVKKAKYD